MGVRPSSPVLRHGTDLHSLAVFSGRFSEGEFKNLRDDFPSDEQPYTDSYEYLSDSDLDEEREYTEIDDDDDESTGVDEPANNLSAAKKRFSWSGEGASDEESGGTTLTQQGKVAIIRDMAATT